MLIDLTEEELEGIRYACLGQACTIERTLVNSDQNDPLSIAEKKQSILMRKIVDKVSNALIV